MNGGMKGIHEMLKEELKNHCEEIESYLMTSSNFGVALLDTDLNILDCNVGFMRLFGLPKKPVGQPITDYVELQEHDIRFGEELKLSCNKIGLNAVLHCQLIRTERGCLLLCERLLLSESRTVEQIGTINNELINLQRELVKKNHNQVKLQQVLDERIVELESALSRVKQLEGIIPICMCCKKIRNDQDIWQQMEAYISQHSEAMFSHGLCPKCEEEQIEIFMNYKRKP
jgi:PAS domain-containing protein